MLNDVHPMRIRKEIDPIFVSNKPSIYINKYKEVFFVLFPGLDKCYNFNQHSKWHSYDVFNHILNVIDNTPNELIIRLIAFFHDIKKPECFKLKDGEGHFKTHQIKSMEYAEEYLKKYAYNKEMVDIICKIILYHDERLKNDDDIIKFIAKFGYDNLDLFYQIQIADMKGQNPNLLYRVEEYQNIINRIKFLFLWCTLK